MNNLTDAAKAGGKRMTAFGVIAIILGMLAMLAPGLTGVSIAMLLGGLVAPELLYPALDGGMLPQRGEL